MDAVLFLLLTTGAAATSSRRSTAFQTTKSTTTTTTTTPSFLFTSSRECVAFSRRQRQRRLFPQNRGCSRRHESVILHRRYQQKEPQGDVATSATKEGKEEAPTTVIGVIAPLVYKGPYPCLGLLFPDLKKENEDDVQLDFLLDTGANVNTLSTELVDLYNLPMTVSSEELATKYGMKGRAGIGASNVGETPPSALYGLPPSRLAGIPGDASFLRNLLVASLPFASPIGDGLLSLSFLSMFPMVEFDWYGTEGDPPTIQFLYCKNVKDLPEQTLQEQDKSALFEKDNDDKPTTSAKEAQSSPSTLLKPIPLDFSLLGIPTLNVTVNGTTLVAILDTGAPMSILSTSAAKAIGLEPSIPFSDDDESDSASSKFDIKEMLKQNQQFGVPGAARQQQPQHKKYGDEVILVGGVDQVPVELHRSKSLHVPIGVASTNDDNDTTTSRTTTGDVVSLGTGPIYIGNLPMFQMLQQVSTKMKQLSGSSVQEIPTMILGLDVLRRSYRMMLQVREKQVWFDEFSPPLDNENVTTLLEKISSQSKLGP